MGYMKYPLQYIGVGADSKNVWVEAHTNVVPIPSLDKPIAVVAPEVADAFGLNGSPCVLIANS